MHRLCYSCHEFSETIDFEDCRVCNCSYCNGCIRRFLMKNGSRKELCIKCLSEIDEEVGR